MNATSYFFHSSIARCYRHLNDYEKAEEEILIALKYRPFDPVNNYEAAMLYIAMGEEDKGMLYLEKANNIWRDADPDYEKANEAKEKWDSMN